MISLDIPPSLLRDIECAAEREGLSVEEAIVHAARERYALTTPFPTNGGVPYTVSREQIDAMRVDDLEPIIRTSETHAFPLFAAEGRERYDVTRDEIEEALSAR